MSENKHEAKTRQGKKRVADPTDNHADNLDKKAAKRRKTANAETETKTEIETQTETEITDEATASSSPVTFVHESKATKEPRLPLLSENEAKDYFVRVQLNPAGSKFFVNIMESLQKVEDGEVNLIFNASGLEIFILDSTKVSATQVKLRAGFWDAFEFFEEDRSHGIRLNLKLFCETLKFVRQKQSHLSLSLFRTKDHLHVQIFNALGTQNLAIPVFALEDEEFVIPETEDFDLIFKVGTEYFKSLINNVKLLSETIVLKRRPHEEEDTKNAEFVFSFSDATRGNAEILCAKEQIQSIEWGVDTAKDFQCSFALKFLHRYIQSATSISDAMTFHVKKDNPLNIRYVFEHDLVQFVYWIAPKIEEQAS